MYNQIEHDERENHKTNQDTNRVRISPEYHRVQTRWYESIEKCQQTISRLIGDTTPDNIIQFIQTTPDNYPMLRTIESTQILLLLSEKIIEKIVVIVTRKIVVVLF